MNEEWAIRAHHTAVPKNEKTKVLLTNDVETAVELHQYDPKGVLSAPFDISHLPLVVIRGKVPSIKHALGGMLVGVVPIWVGSNLGALSFTASRSNLGNMFSPRDTRSQGHSNSI